MKELQMREAEEYCGAMTKAAGGHVAPEFGF